MVKKELDDGLCAFLCRDYCIAKKGHDPKTCPIKREYRSSIDNPKEKGDK